MKKILLWTILVLIQALTAPRLQASQVTSYNIEELGEWAEGRNWAIAAHGNIVYLGNGPQFQIIDYNNPSHPEVLASIAVAEPEGQVYDIDVLNGMAYVVTLDQVSVIDVTNPTNPVIVLQQEVPFTFWIDATSDYIFASGLSGVRIMEWAGGDSFTQLSKYPDFGWPCPVVFASTSDAEVRGDYVYYGHGGITVLDIADASAPQVVGHHSEYPQGNSRVALQGDRVFMITGGLLRIFDVSDPTNPSKIDSLFAPGYAYFNDIVPVGQYAYCATQKDLLVVAISGVQPPAIVWNRQIGSTGLAKSENRVFVSYNSWVQSLDVTSPVSPVEGAKLPTGSNYRDLKLDGNTAYIADEQYGLRIIDVSNPANPWPAGHHYLDDTVTQLAVVKDHVYLFGYYSMSVIDVGDSENPVETFRRLSPHYYASTAVSEEYLFVSKQHAGFEVLDVSDPSTPVEAAEYGVNLGVDPLLALEGNLLFVVEGRFMPSKYGWLRIIDVSDPVNPVEIGSFPLLELKGTGDYPYDIAVSRGYVFLPSGTNGLKIIDATNPSAPREINRVGTGGKIASASVSGNLLYIAEVLPPGWFSDPLIIRVLNVSDPTNPVEAGRYVETPPISRPILLADEQTLYCKLRSNLSILEFQRGGLKDEPKIKLLSNTGSPIGKLNLGLVSPNPFNPTTAIRYTLPVTGPTRLEIFDVQGKLIKILVEGSESAGKHTAMWNGRNDKGVAAPSGVYFVRLEFGEEVQTRKITLLK